MYIITQTYLRFCKK